MEKCPKCSAELVDRQCSECGFDSTLELDETIAQPVREDENTRIQESDTKSEPFSTTAGDTEFVAGAILDDRYRILGLLGKGGMGEVYKAEDLKLEQTVALKFLPENLAENKEALRRFVGEVKTARQVSHENVCRVFDISETNGRNFLSMEYIDGDDLSQLLKRIGRLPSDKAVEISRQICMGLNAIHKTGILHRDLKPANIIIDSSGKARITDFGIAGFEADVQGAESRVGTPAYMSPEQREGKEVTQRSDIYSLGLLLYEIFTGKQAVDGNTLDLNITQHSTTSLNKSTEFQDTLDPAVEKLIERCLEMDPADRPDSAVRVALGLPGENPLQVALEAGETPSPEMVAAAGTKGSLKPPIALGLLVATIVVFATTLFWATNHHIHSYTPLDKSPDVLRERAKEIIRNAGYTEEPADSSEGFSIDTSYLNSSIQSEYEKPFERLRKGQPYLMFFWYRESPEQLVDNNSSRIFENTPIFREPGEISVRLDATGRLTRFVAVPPVQKSADTTAKTDWTAILNEAGLKAENLKESDPKVNSPYFSDEHKAWEGALADFPDMPIRIEAAGYNGKLVYFEVLMASDRRLTEKESAVAASRQQASNIGNIIGISIVALFILGAVFISYRNLKIGRVDLKGAARISLFCFVAQFLGFAIAADHTMSINGEFTILINIAVMSVFLSFLLFLAYLAIEPYVRRFWSELLISWNRLLSGDFRDPMVGRDILIGALLGSLQTASFYVGGFMRDYSVARELTITSGSGTISGYRDVLQYIIVNSFAQQIIVGVGILLFLLMFYLLLRRKWAGTVLAILVITVVQSVGLFPVRGWSYALLQLTIAAILFTAFARFGLVTIIATLFFGNLLTIEMTFDSSRFYVINTVTVVVIGLGIAIFAFYNSMAGKSLFGEFAPPDQTRSSG